MRTQYGRLASGGMALTALACTCLAATVGDAAQTDMVKGRVEAGEDGRPTWIGMLGDNPEAANWVRVDGRDFEIALPAAASATMLAIARDRVPLVIPIAGGVPKGVLELRMRSGLALSGTVSSEDGWPLRGAEITVRPAAGYSFDMPPFAAPRWSSDRFGGFSAGGLLPGDHVVEVTAEGHIPLVLDDVRILAGEANRVDVELALAYAIAGRVVDAKGAPVADAEVRTDYRDDVARTEADGSYRLGPFRMADKREVYATAKEGGSSLRHAVSAPRDGLVLELHRCAVLGRVVDAATGAPLKRFTVFVTDGSRIVTAGRPSFPWVQHQVEAADGAFRLEVDIVAHTLFVRAPRHVATLVPLAMGRRAMHAANCSPVGDELDVGVVALERSRSIRGRATDAATGAPIAGAYVERIRTKSDDSYWSRAGRLLASARTDENGSFALAGLPAKAAVRAEAAGYRRAVLSVPEGVEYVDLELEALRHARGYRRNSRAAGPNAGRCTGNCLAVRGGGLLRRSLPVGDDIRTRV